MGLSDWGAGSCDVIRRSLGAPNIESIAFDLSHFQDLHHVIPALSSEIPARHPHLRILRIEQSTNGKQATLSPPQQTQLSRLIETLRELESLTVTNLGGDLYEVWEAAGRLPSLSHCFIPGSNKAPVRHIVSAPFGPSFPSAICLEFRWVTSPQMPALLDSISSSQLEELHVNGPRFQAEADFTASGALRTIGRFRELREVQLWLYDASVEWEDVVPLLSCPLLEAVSIGAWKLSAAVTDEGLSLMARTWPDLVSLAVYDSHPLAIEEPTHIPSATLQGLACFAIYTPLLENLTISVEARGVDPDVAYTAVGRYIKELNLWYSVADAEGATKIAEFIATMWPNQKHPDRLTLWTPEAPGGYQVGRWLSVQEYRRDEIVSSPSRTLTSFHTSNSLSSFS